MDLNPFAPENRENPYPIYRTMRDRHPAYYDTSLGSWALTRFADVSRALQDPALYSSVQGMGTGRGEGASMSMANIPMLIMTDPPRHTQLRSLVNRAFTPRRINTLEGRIREIATQLIDDIVDRSSCDLVADFTGPLPTITIAELLGVPAEDHKWFKEKSNALLNRPPERQRDVDPQTVMQPILELTQYLNRIYEQRRKEPRDDLMSALLAAEIEDQRLTPPELIGFALLLLIAGNETTTNLISNGLVLLHDYPEQRALLLRDPSRIPAAIEEFLRFESPVPGIGRVLTDDISLHGQDLRKGQRVMLYFGAANRDERQFEDPDRFDITRKPAQHLAFGFATHFCLGASLARLEARVAFEEIFARLPEVTLLRDRAERNQGGIRGYASLPAELAKTVPPA